MTNTNGTYEANKGTSVSSLESEVSTSEINNACADVSNSPRDALTSARASSDQSHAAYVAKGKPQGILGILVTYITDPIGITSAEKRWQKDYDCITEKICAADQKIKRAETGIQTLLEEGKVLNEKVREVESVNSRLETQHKKITEDFNQLKSDYQRAKDEYGKLPDEDAGKGSMEERLKGYVRELTSLEVKKQETGINRSRTTSAITIRAQELKYNQEQLLEQQNNRAALTEHRNMLECERMEYAPFVRKPVGVSEKDVLDTVSEGISVVSNIKSGTRELMNDVRDAKDSSIEAVARIGETSEENRTDRLEKLRKQNHEYNHRMDVRAAKVRKDLLEF